MDKPKETHPSILNNSFFVKTFQFSGINKTAYIPLQNVFYEREEIKWLTKEVKKQLI